ncbi:hypothetical protein JG687_00010648 [Phytophthora cactorum]|uniref:Tc3 transposase DNA binding domain-containing protein n=1 Tax=Phytophthora cactorum TaxID=29920 RepID=A0A329SBY5_9STRA|nr:hypothetical protein JG687_00010648 [Phytophthora cactorum]RAW33092.1 hypothetical protein PC110_g10577 [Phytophthora cactorum]
MRRGPPLTDEDLGRIQGLSEGGLSARAIAKKVKRSRDCVQRAKSRSQATPPLPSRQKALSLEAPVTRVVRKVSTGNFSSTRLKEKLGCPCTARTIRRLLSGVDWLDYAKMGNTLLLMEQHKMDRLNWAKNMIIHPDKWPQIIFSDEKKFNLDGPDGLRHYWRDVRRPARQTVRWQNGEHYIYTVSEYMLPFAHLHHGVDYIYHQDNASIHRSKLTMKFFEEEGIKLLDWPAR